MAKRDCGEIYRDGTANLIFFKADASVVTSLWAWAR